MPARRNSRLATRLAFAAAGFGTACWAPLVPFAQARLGVGDATLGLLLLCLGAGSVASMPLAGGLAARWGSRPVILVGGFGLAVALPPLALVSRPAALAAALVAFGAVLGALDVAMNLHAVAVESAAARPLMSGFHALFSIGAFAGAGLITLLLANHFSPAASATLGALVVAAAIATAWPHLQPARPPARPHPFVALPRGVVLVLALLAFISFLIEGALLDWSALLLVSTGLLATSTAGAGYMVFAIAMVAGRLGGDRATARLGPSRLLLLSGLAALAGFSLLLAARQAPLALAGFVLIGLGAANIVPTLFRRAGNQPDMPAPLALAAVLTAGYAGLLAGPALVGFIASTAGLRAAFLALALLLIVIPVLHRSVACTARTRRPRASSGRGRGMQHRPPRAIRRWR